MFKDLPPELQTKVMVYLQADQFPKAKQLVDEYRKNHQSPASVTLSNC